MSYLQRVFTSIRLKQKLLEENLSLESYLKPHALQPNVIQEPFPHIVIDNFFHEGFVEKVSAYFNELLSKGLSEDPLVRDRFHPFNEAQPYDGYVYAPSPSGDEPLKLFFSVVWNQYFSKLFGKPTTFGTNLTFHHHPPGNRTGFIHSDYTSFLFPQQKILTNGVHVLQFKPTHIHTPLERNFEPLKQKRTIALLYYFNSPEWKEGDGGETGMYLSAEDKEPLKKIAPLDNRLFAFDISPNSLHAFQENLKERNCLVQWFHIDEAWALKRYSKV